MAYELYLRRPSDKPLDDASLEKRILELGGRMDGNRYALGETQVRVRVQRDEKGLLGFDVEVPFGCPEREMRDAFAAAISISELGPMTLFDPQMGRSVSKGSLDDVLEAWRRASSWQIDVAGLREDARAIAPVHPVKPLLEPGTKRLFIVIGVALFVLWLASQVVTTFVFHQ